MKDESLYLIAILAPPHIAEEVTAIKREFAERFESSHALILPPHITLQAPFKLHSSRVEPLKNELSLHFGNYLSMRVALKDFGCFAKRRNPVIFIQLTDNPYLQALHDKLMIFLREIGFSENETALDFHPHVTVAHRDLSTHHFKRAWAEFEQRSFNAEFEVKAIHLLRHDGKFWIPVAEFALGMSNG